MDERKQDLERAGRDSGLSRKLFFERVGWIGLAVLSVAAIPGLIRFLKPRKIGGSGALLDAGALADLRAARVTARWLKRYRLWVVHDRDTLFALEARCTHLGCTPRWDAGAGVFHCPCHGSQFTPQGIPLNGPAVEPLYRFAIWVEGDRVMVDPSARATLEQAELRDEFIVHL